MLFFANVFRHETFSYVHRYNAMERWRTEQFALRTNQRAQESRIFIQNFHNFQIPKGTERSINCKKPEISWYRICEMELLRLLLLMYDST